MKKTLKVAVVQSENKEEIVEKSVLAQAIVEMSNSMKRLLAAGINRDCIAVLTQHNCRGVKWGAAYGKTKPNLKTVEAVLDSLADLKRRYVQP